MTIQKENSRKTREDLKTLYEIKSDKALNKYLKAILEIISAALRSQRGYAKVRFDRLYKALSPFVFGEPQPHQVGFTDDSVKRDTFNIGLSQKILQVLLLEKNKALDSFVAELNNALAKKYQCDTFNIEYLFEHNTAESLRAAFKAYKKEHRVKPIKKKLTQKESVKETLQNILESEGVHDLKEVDESSMCFVGMTRDLRSKIKSLIGLTDQQVSNAFNQLETAGEIRRTGSHFNKEIFLPASNISKIVGKSASIADNGSKNSASSRSSYLSDAEKGERIIEAINVIFARADRKSPRSHKQEIGNIEVSYIYIGRQDKILDDLEEISGLSGNQRRNALNYLEENQVIYVSGSPIGGRAKYYLREDQLNSEDETEKELEEASRIEPDGVSVEEGAEINVLALLDKSNLTQIEQAAKSVHKEIEQTRMDIKKLQEKKDSLEGKSRILDSIFRELK